MFLAGDVGGTKTRLAIFTAEKGKLTRKETEQYKSNAFPNLEAIIQEFLGKHPTKINNACFGVPGPVVNGTVKITNLPWQLSEKEIAKTVGFKTVKLVNDLVATAAAIPHFQPADLHVLYEGESERDKSVAAVVAPGTGLGQAMLYRTDKKTYVLPSEGGHACYAPASELEIELLLYLKRKYGIVVNERVMCGPGLYNIYEFLRESGYGEEPAELKEMFTKEDPAAVISKTGLAGQYDLCSRALDLFSSILGSHAGDMVLTLMATGGVYLGGGIPPKIISKLSEGGTVQAFLNKKLANVVKATPLYVIKDDFAALMGAAHLASEL